MGDLIQISGFGKLSMASDLNAPLLIVFGGTVVGGRTSGDYMWDYMDSLKDSFHIFVASHPHVKGGEAYEALIDRVGKEKGTPARQVLYLFSGGWRPGKVVLANEGSKTFSLILLVDIWMGDADVAKFYKALVDKDGDKIFYVFTKNGPDDPDTRDYMAKKLGPKKAMMIDYQTGVDHTQTHMSTNETAVGLVK